MATESDAGEISSVRIELREDDTTLPIVLVENYLSDETADELLRHCLENVPWQVEHIKMFGQNHLAPRLSCSMGDDGLKYKYRGSQGRTFPFTPMLDSIRLRLAREYDVPFNFVLANRYRDGSDYVGWHADDEKDLLHRGTIASLSLGATRSFRLRANSTPYTETYCLKHGSLLLMFGNCQENFKHTLVKTACSVDERVNLSYRCVVN